MAKSTKISITLPPASYALLQQAAEDNGTNGAAAASLILQAALARRISGLVPKRPVKAGTDGGQPSGTPAAEASRDAAAEDTAPSLGLPEGSGTK